MRLDDLSRYAPVGMKLHMEKTIWGLCLIASWIYSGLFLVRFADACGELYEYNGVKQVLMEGARMERFGTLLGNGLNGFAITAMVMMLFSIYHYLYHFQDSKSIYLMRRLPNRWELSRRCLTLPVAAAVLSLAAAVLLLGFYFGIYLVFTPKGCLPW